MCFEHVGKVQGVIREDKGSPMVADVWPSKHCKVDIHHSLAF